MYSAISRYVIKVGVLAGFNPGSVFGVNGETRAVRGGMAALMVMGAATLMGATSRRVMDGARPVTSARRLAPRDIYMIYSHLTEYLH